MNLRQDSSDNSYTRYHTTADISHMAATIPRTKLTNREQETLYHLAAGLTSEEISLRLYICKETVDTHRKNIIRKLGVSNVTAAVAHALRNKIIS